jgi:hypothetical protein
LGIVAIALLLESPLVGLPLAAAIALCAGVVLAVNSFLSSTRKAELPPKLRTAGRAVALLLNVPLVVMGHSHKPAVASDETLKARYVNTGTWIPAHGDKSVSFTHLMVGAAPPRPPTAARAPSTPSSAAGTPPSRGPSPSPKANCAGRQCAAVWRIALGSPVRGDRSRAGSGAKPQI